MVVLVHMPHSVEKSMERMLRRSKKNKQTCNLVTVSKNREDEEEESEYTKGSNNRDDQLEDLKQEGPASTTQ